MRKHLAAGVILALAALVPWGTASASAAPAPAEPVAAGYGMSTGAGSGCSAIAPTALSQVAAPGWVPVLYGTPDSSAIWCWGSYARVTRAGQTLLPGGVGEWLPIDEYAVQTAHSVAVVHAPDGLTAVYVF